MDQLVSNETAYAYAETIELLKYTDPVLVDKIPKKLIKIFKDNADPNYKEHIDGSKTLEEQDISKKTAVLFGMIMINYWCETKEEKKHILSIFEESDKKYEAEMREKYNPDNLFKDKKTQEEEEELSQETSQETSSEEIDEQNNETDSEENKDKLPMDYNSMPWFKKIFIKFTTFIKSLFKFEAKN